MSKKKLKAAKVVVVMGSQSDLPVMREASELLSDWGISVETTIVSAHRTPQLLNKSVDRWQADEVRVIIAGAGGAAHLPGMIASYSYLPVIGVPVRTKTLDGLDSLLSIAQMPKGVPVATVAVDNAVNAALLAAEILATSSEAWGKKLRVKIISYKKKLFNDVSKQKKKLKAEGISRFLKRSKR